VDNVRDKGVVEDDYASFGRPAPYIDAVVEDDGPRGWIFRNITLASRPGCSLRTWWLSDLSRHFQFRQKLNHNDTDAGQSYWNCESLNYYLKKRRNTPIRTEYGFSSKCDPIFLKDKLVIILVIRVVDIEMDCIVIQESSPEEAESENPY
jgi:hypothetical protein